MPDQLKERAEQVKLDMERIMADKLKEIQEKTKIEEKENNELLSIEYERKILEQKKIIEEKNKREEELTLKEKELIEQTRQHRIEMKTQMRKKAKLIEEEVLKESRLKEEEYERKLEEQKKNIDTRMGRWAVELKATGEFVGNFVIVPIPDDPEKTQLGYSFTPGNWGKGFATEVTKAGLEYFRNKTPLTEIYAVTESPHIASQKVLQKAGFEYFGKKNEGEKELTVFIVRR